MCVRLPSCPVASRDEMAQSRTYSEELEISTEETQELPVTFHYRLWVVLSA